MVREIKITPVLNGFVCKVGCQTVVFQDAVTMASEIKRYYDNPEVVEKKYISEAVNKMPECPAVDPVPSPGPEMLSVAGIVSGERLR